MLQDRVNVPDADLQPTVSNLLAIYALASSLTSPIAGILADKLSVSRQIPFLLGLVFMILSTFLLAIGRSVPVIALARFLQGASGGVLWTIGTAILAETVGLDNLGRTVGTIMSIVTATTVFAPFVGGTLYVKTGYNGVFGVGLAVLIVDLLMRLLMIEKNAAEKRAEDHPEDASSSASGDRTATESTPLIREDNDDENTAFQLPQPQNRLTKTFPIILMLADPSLLTASFVAFMQAILLGAFDATIPLVASSHYGFDSLKAGLLFLPLGCTDLLLGPVCGWCIDRWGTRIVGVIGFLFLVPALVLLRLPFEQAVVDSLSTAHQITLYAALLAVNGIGEAIIAPIPTVESGLIVDKYWKANRDLFVRAPYAQLYGINSMLWSGGLTVGPLVAGALKDNIGYGNMNAVLSGLCGLAAILSFLFLGRK